MVCNSDFPNQIENVNYHPLHTTYPTEVHYMHITLTANHICMLKDPFYCSVQLRWLYLKPLKYHTLQNTEHTDPTGYTPKSDLS